MADTYDRYENEAGGGGFMMGLLTGTVLGAGLGMLLAPKAGADLRGQISEQARQFGTKASEQYRRASDTASSWAGRGREFVNQARDAVSRGAEEARGYAGGAGESGSYGGVTDVRGGVLRANEGVGLPANTSLRLNGGLWEVTQPTTMTRSLGTAAGNIQLLGAAGFSALDAGGTLRIQLNGGTGQVQWGSANFNPTILGFGRNASAGNESYSFENDIDLNGATRTIGAANKALCETIAAALGVPKRAVELVAGATQRTKTLRIAGEASALAAKLAHLTGRSG